MRRIHIDGELYVERFYLLGREPDVALEFDGLKLRFGWLPFTIYLQHFCKSDSQDLHNHPWPARSLILAGGYVEEREDGFHPRAVGSCFAIPLEAFHRVHLVERDCWTLFAAGRISQFWGFKVNGVFVNYRTYLRGDR